MEIMVIGTGGVGLVAACCLVNSGHHVTGVKINEARLNFLGCGSNPVYEKVIELHKIKNSKVLQSHGEMLYGGKRLNDISSGAWSSIYCRDSEL